MGSIRPRRDLLLLILFLLASGIQAHAADLLVLRFDDSLVGEEGEVPTQQSGISFGSGVDDRAAWFPDPSALHYAGAGNIDEIEGTFECWMRPSWNGNDGQSYMLLRYGVSGGMLIGKDGANNFRIILNRFGVHPGGEVGIHINVGDWSAGDWHHVAFTWSDAAKTLQLYIDGALRREETFTADLPTITSDTIQIGADGGSSYVEADLDNLRLSSGVRSPQEIVAHMMEGLTVYGWGLDESGPAELWPTWNWWLQPTISAETNAGTLPLPMTAADWTSSRSKVAVYDPEINRIKAMGPGNAMLTGTLADQLNTIAVHVIEPVLEPEEETIDPFMATPASDYLHRMPVVIFRYFPTTDGIGLDPTICGLSTSLVDIKAKADSLEKQKKFMLEEGSRFRGYGDAAAAASLGYEVIKVITVYEDIPPGFVLDPGEGTYFPDYNQILERWNGERLVREFGVKEFWLWQYHWGRLVPNESNMSSPTTGDISNSYRTNGDQPIFDRTYVTYGITMSRQANEAVHNHGHQLESILTRANQQQDGNGELFWQKFVGLDSTGQFQHGRCGDTHHPPNADDHYDYYNSNLVWSDIEDWTPEGSGEQTLVNASTWGGIPYSWPDDNPPPGTTEAQWYIYWMQAMPGRDNGIPYNADVMTNWWRFTGDWDASVLAGLGLYGPVGCGYGLSSTGDTFDSCGGVVNVDITAATGCKWIASANHPWLRVTAGGTGDGNGTATIEVGINDGPARSGTVAIAGQLFHISQSEGGAGAPGEVALLTLGGGGVTDLSWSTTGGADYYDVARGSLSGLADRSYGDCLQDDLAATGTTDADIPGPGSGFFYLVRGVNGATCAAGRYGHDSGGAERENIEVDRCPL
jgi:hypothetical protein